MTIFLDPYYVIDVSKIISYRMHCRKVWKGLSAWLRALQKHDAVPPRGWNVCNRMWTRFHRRYVQNRYARNVFEDIVCYQWHFSFKSISLELLFNFVSFVLHPFFFMTITRYTSKLHITINNDLFCHLFGRRN